jgi:hypothetical protein
MIGMDGACADPFTTPNDMINTNIANVFLIKLDAAFKKLRKSITKISINLLRKY